MMINTKESWDYTVKTIVCHSLRDCLTLWISALRNVIPFPILLSGANFYPQLRYLYSNKPHSPFIFFFFLLGLSPHSFWLKVSFLGEFVGEIEKSCWT